MLYNKWPEGKEVGIQEREIDEWRNEGIGRGIGRGSGGCGARKRRGGEVRNRI